MKVIEGKFGKQEEAETEHTTADMFFAFHEMAAELEDQDIESEAVIIMLTPAGLTMGGNVMTPEDVNFLLDMAKHVLMNSAFGVEQEDYDGPLH